MPPEHQTDLTPLAVAIGEIRVTVSEGFKAVNERLDTLTGVSKDHGDTLQRHEVAIQLLKSQQRPKAAWYSVVGAIASIVTGLGGVIALIVVASKIAQVAG